jgi:hypothetical protein
LRITHEEHCKAIADDRAALVGKVKLLEDEVSRLQALSEENEALYREDQSNTKMVINRLREQTEKICRERDDYKNEVERRKASKHHKIKDYDRMKDQVSECAIVLS